MVSGVSRRVPWTKSRTRSSSTISVGIDLRTWLGHHPGHQQPPSRAPMRRYSLAMIALHWSTALLVVAAYLTSEGGPGVRADPPVLHMTLGVAVLVLLLPRLVSRFVGGVPPVENPHGKWLDLAARIGHWVLYALLVFIPLTGWYTASRLGLHVSFFGIQLPCPDGPCRRSARHGRRPSPAGG